MDPASVRNKILNAMQGAPVQHQAPKMGKVYQRLDGVVDPRDRTSISRFLQEPSRMEIEVSFGSYRPSNNGRFDDQFTPGLLSITQFETLTRALQAIVPDYKVINDRTEIMDKQHIRRIVNLDDPKNPQETYQRKIRHKDFVDNRIWGYRISKSEESFTTKPTEFTFAPDIVRHRHRTSFVVRDPRSTMYGLQFDLSRVREVKMKLITITKTIEADNAYDPEYRYEEGEIIETEDYKWVEDRAYVKYEVEIERNTPIAAMGVIPVANLEAAIEFVLFTIQDAKSVSHLATMEEIRDAVRRHNDLFAADIIESRAKMNNPYRLFKDYWNKPTNIKVDDLISPKLDEMAVTIKLNGARRFLLFTKEAIYSMGPPSDIYKADKGIPELDGTLLDTEMYTNPKTGVVTYFVFDILFDRGVNIRQANFGIRTKHMADMPQKIKPHVTRIRVALKQYFTGTDSFYKKVKRALEYIDENPDMDTDGLIFQPQHWYKNNHTKKWKPEDELTIDFLAQDVLDNGELVDGMEDAYELMVGDRKGLVAFVGNNKNPAPEFLNVAGTEFSGKSLNGHVIECAWNFEREEWVPRRLRLDRDKPNALTTAQDVWRDIMDPITRATIEGNSLRAMRRYHNKVKSNLLRAEFSSGATIMDWGSGRGGDLGKWEDIGFKKVYVVEPNETNLKELERRMKQMRKPTRDQPRVEVEICRASDDTLLGGENTDELVNIVKAGGQPALDGIVAFFSLTFFGRDDNMWESMLSSFDRLIETGGKVVGIVMDGDRTKELLNQSRVYNRIDPDDAADYTCPSFVISQVTEFGTTDIGDEIGIKIIEETSMVRGDGDDGAQQEWLFYFGRLQKDMEKLGFVLNRGGFLSQNDDSTKKDLAGVDVLPEDSKVFNRLNRFFVFTRRSDIVRPRERYRRELGPLGVDDMDEFITGPGLSGTSEMDFRRVGIIRDPSNFIHAVVRAFSHKYYYMTVSERREYVKKIRGMIGRKITMDQYEKINDGEIAHKYKTAAIKDLRQHSDAVTDEDAQELGFLEYRLKLMDPDAHISANSAAEYLSELLDINIVVLNANGKNTTKPHGSRDHEYVRNVLYSHPKTVFLVSTNGIHYDLMVGFIDQTQPIIYSLFDRDSRVVDHFLKFED